MLNLLCGQEKTASCRKHATQQRHKTVHTDDSSKRDLLLPQVGILRIFWLTFDLQCISILPAGSIPRRTSASAGR